MANVNAARGLIPVRYLNGAPYNGAHNLYLIPATDGTPTFVGDAVSLAGSAGSAGTIVAGVDVEGMPTVNQSAAGSTPVGVVVGFMPRPDALTTLRRDSSVATIALVADDPNLIFEVQEDSLVSTLKAADVAENVDLVVAAGNATTGVSGVMLDSSTHTTSAATCRILRLVPRVDNQMGDGTLNSSSTTSPYAKWEVMLAEHAYRIVASV